MARYKDYSYDQAKLLPVSFARQILPGTFEYTLSYLIDHEVDLSVFAERYKNDETGAPAYDPAILLKIVLYAYSRGVMTSREIERLCRENVVVMALSADTQAHFTTIAHFVSSSEEEIAQVFRDVLLVCDEQGLIGREMFAIDGCKLPSNASKEWSGTKEEFAKKVRKMEKAVRYLVQRHRALDAGGREGEQYEREERQIRTLRAKARKLRQWLGQNKDKVGRRGQAKKSNVTDNESAKMKTSRGVIQGYVGVVAADAKHQVIVHAQAYGEAQEHALLEPTIEGVRESFAAIGEAQDIFDQARLTADSGYHTEKNMEKLFTEGIDGYVADTGFRKRDPRFAEVDRYKERSRGERRAQRRADGGVFTNKDFTYDPQRQLCVCPAGKKLYRSGSGVSIRGYLAMKFKAPKSACRGCALRTQCLRHPQRTETRQVAFFNGRASGLPETFTAKMKRKIDAPLGRWLYSLRLGIVEPVFGNITSAKRLNRFTLRGRSKVNAQWVLYCLVHNVGKIHRYAVGFT